MGGLSLLPPLRCAALLRGFPGPALGYMSHIAGMSGFCLALCLGLFQVASCLVFSG